MAACFAKKRSLGLGEICCYVLVALLLLYASAAWTATASTAVHLDGVERLKRFAARQTECLQLFHDVCRSVLKIFSPAADGTGREGADVEKK
eukprot:9362758-Prorocentrum_lima.AAC.1